MAYASRRALANLAGGVGYGLFRQYQLTMNQTTRRRNRGRFKLCNNTYLLCGRVKWPHHPEPLETYALQLHKTAIVYVCADAHASSAFDFDDAMLTKDRYPNPSGEYGLAGGKVRWRYHKICDSAFVHYGGLSRSGELPVSIPGHTVATSDGRLFLPTHLQVKYGVTGALRISDVRREATLLEAVRQLTAPMIEDGAPMAAIASDLVGQVDTSTGNKHQLEMALRGVLAAGEGDFKRARALLSHGLWRRHLTPAGRAMFPLVAAPVMVEWLLDRARHGSHPVAFGCTLFEDEAGVRFPVNLDGETGAGVTVALVSQIIERSRRLTARRRKLRAATEGSHAGE